MITKVKKLTETAKLPVKQHESDFCYDVYADSVEQIAPNIYKYHTGLAFQIEKTWSQMMHVDGSLSIDFRPRSSVWKTGMVLSNSVGTIDEDYTGEVTAVFYHVFPDMPKYEVGDRIGQIKIGITTPVKWEEVDELDETERGAGGYGSTGK